MLKSGVKPIIFVLNNSGYTIERYLHGENAHYNDITNWCVFLYLHFHFNLHSHVLCFKQAMDQDL